MTRNRGKNLNDSSIGLIVGVLDGWSGKLTWDLLIAAIEERMSVRYTRQALDRHARIKIAYQATKERLNGAPRAESTNKLSPIEVVAITERFARLQAENLRLKVENERLLEQFVTWAYNAHLKGLTKEYLNRPLPSIDRETTRGRPSSP